MDNLFENMSSKDLSMFKLCVRTLLDSTFIVQEEDQELYLFITSGSNQQIIADYLKMMGYNLVVREDHGVAMLVLNSEDEDTPGLKKLSRNGLQSLSADKIKLLLVLWMIYDENKGTGKKVYTSIGEIHDKSAAYNNGESFKQPVLKECIPLFKRFSLIDCKGSIANRDTVVQLYPSLKFCLDEDQLKLVIESILPGEENVEDEQDEENS